MISGCSQPSAHSARVTDAEAQRPPVAALSVTVDGNNRGMRQTFSNCFKVIICEIINKEQFEKRQDFWGA